MEEGEKILREKRERERKRVGSGNHPLATGQIPASIHTYSSQTAARKEGRLAWAHIGCLEEGGAVCLGIRELR